MGRSRKLSRSACGIIQLAQALAYPAEAATERGIAKPANLGLSVLGFWIWRLNLPKATFLFYTRVCRNSVGVRDPEALQHPSFENLPEDIGPSVLQN